MNSKKYTKPSALKMEIDTEIVRMLTREGFIDLLWEKLVEARETNPKITRKEIFEILNEKYYRVIGCFRYSSYESFRKRLGKKC